MVNVDLTPPVKAKQLSEVSQDGDHPLANLLIGSEVQTRLANSLVHPPSQFRMEGPLG